MQRNRAAGGRATAPEDWNAKTVQRILAAAALCVSVLAAQSPMTNVAKGDMSGQQTARQVVIRHAEEWKALWKDHSPTQKMPAIDFGRDMVVGIFLGTKPSDGHSVEIVAVRPQENEVVVDYVRREPGRARMAAQILTEPYHLVSVPRHAGTVRFVHAPDIGVIGR